MFRNHQYTCVKTKIYLVFHVMFAMLFLISLHCVTLSSTGSGCDVKVQKDEISSKRDSLGET